MQVTTVVFLGWAEQHFHFTFNTLQAWTECSQINKKTAAAQGKTQFKSSLNACLVVPSEITVIYHSTHVPYAQEWFNHRERVNVKAFRRRHYFERSSHAMFAMSEKGFMGEWRSNYIQSQSKEANRWKFVTVWFENLSTWCRVTKSSPWIRNEGQTHVVVCGNIKLNDSITCTVTKLQDYMVICDMYLLLDTSYQLYFAVLQLVVLHIFVHLNEPPTLWCFISY